MMHDAHILDGLRAVLREHVQIEHAVTGDMDLQTDLGLDSLQLLTFVVETENHFAITFAPEAESELKTLNDVVAYIREQKNVDSKNKARL